MNIGISPVILVEMFQVKLLETLLNLDEEKFPQENRFWSTTLSNGTEVNLRFDSDGNPRRLRYDERENYCLEVQKIRMGESSEQVQTPQCPSKLQRSFILHFLRDQQEILGLSILHF